MSSQYSRRRNRDRGWQKNLKKGLDIVALFVVIFVAHALEDDMIISKATYAAIIVIVTLAAVAYFVFFLFRISAVKKKGQRAHLDRYGATMSPTLKHLNGLPIAKDLPVEVLYCPDRLVFRKDSQEITVSLDKVTAIDVTTGRNVGRKALAAATTAKKSVTEIAKEVIAGKWGNGDARKKALTAAGYDYNTVQKKVNELLK